MSTGMTPAERVEIEHTCGKLVILFCHYNDARDYDSLAALFTEDGVFARPTDPANPIKGRAQIGQRFSAKPAHLLTQHLVTNVIVTVDSETTAHGTSSVMLYTGNEPEGAERPVPAAPKALIGGFKSHFVKTEEGWRLAEHLGSLALTIGGE